MQFVNVHAFEEEEQFLENSPSHWLILYSYN